MSLMKSTLALTAPLALVALLGGCKDKQPQTAQAAGGAELLPRSVSDDMPAYDTVRSKAPLAEPSATPDTHSAPAASEEDATSDDDAPVDDDEAPPVAEPQPQGGSVTPDAE